MKKKFLLTIFLFSLILIILSFRIFEFFKPFLPHLNYLLGSNQPTSYLILLGNDTEARANGGFAGSYAKIVIARREATKQPPRRGLLQNYVLRNDDMKFSFHDIYVPNGQLEGYVKPPDAIQQAFGHGTWELANADYEPHFPTTASSIRWFLDKGKETNPDILGIINLSTIKKIFNIIGEIKLNESTIITPDNLYLYLQGKAELNFFPGSTQKADALHEVGNATLSKLKALPLTKKVKIAKEIYKDLQNQNIVLNSTNLNFQKFLESKKWAGEYNFPNSTDFFGLVELNLGANKANAYVTRQTNHQIFLEDNQIKHNVQVNFQNSSPEANPNPPLYYGGNYISFLRLYLPKNATDIEIIHTEIATSSAGFSSDILNNQSPLVNPCNPISENCNLTSISFWHLTPAGQHSDIKLSYSLPSQDPKKNSLTLLKQNGFPTSPQTIKMFDQTFKTDLLSTQTFQIK